MSSVRKLVWKAAFEAYLLTRPRKVADLMRRYPPGTRVEVDGEILWMIGAGETEADPVLILSRINPAEDYAAATAEAERVVICPSCLEDES